MPNEIFFSIIIPTYNREEFIFKTLETALNQDYQNFEIIVVDDESTDNTEQFFKEFHNPKVHYFRKRNAERAAARNYGLKKAQGDYITFLDSDDILYPNHLREAKKLIENNNFPEFLHLAYEMKTPEGKILSQNNQRKGDLNKQLLTGNHLSCIGVFLKKEIALEFPFSENRELSGTEDWELWMRLASRFKIYYSNQTTSAIINHEERSVLQIDEKKIKKRIDLALKYIFADEAFEAKYGQYKNIAQAHLYLYICLHLILAKQKKRSLFYLKKAIFWYPQIIFNRKTLAILKHIIF